jgi:hypothetical protein
LQPLGRLTFGNKTRGSVVARMARKRLTPWWIVGIVLLVVALLALGGVLIAHSSGSSSTPTTAATTTTTAASKAAPIGPVAMSAAALVAFAQALARPIYWAGPTRGDRYELTRTSAGNVFVRYLPPGVQVGDKRPAFTVVGTYPYAGALADLMAVPNAKRDTIAGGGIVLSTTADPKSVHIAYPGIDFQIEVFDPVPGRARLIALSGRVRPVG